MIHIRPRNWTKFQHYKGRRPPWVKLHRALLDDFEWHQLPLASKALAPMLWLLASETVEGDIQGPESAIAFRLHISVSDLLDALKPLIDGDFFQNASRTLAPRKQLAPSESETERFRETPSGFPLKDTTTPIAAHEALGAPAHNTSSVLTALGEGKRA